MYYCGELHSHSLLGNCGSAACFLLASGPGDVFRELVRQRFCVHWLSRVVSFLDKGMMFARLTTFVFFHTPATSSGAVTLACPLRRWRRVGTELYRLTNEAVVFIACNAPNYEGSALGRPTQATCPRCLYHLQ